LDGRKITLEILVRYIFLGMGEKRNAYKILVGKPGGKSHWEDQDAGG
jgi:hypothetical protein